MISKDFPSSCKSFRTSKNKTKVSKPLKKNVVFQVPGKQVAANFHQLYP